jgi:hypothetical protein
MLEMQAGGNVATLKRRRRYCDKNVTYPAKRDTKLSYIFVREAYGKKKTKTREARGGAPRRWDSAA